MWPFTGWLAIYVNECAYRFDTAHQIIIEKYLKVITCPYLFLTNLTSFS